MTKKDLRTGMVVTYRNGEKRTVFCDVYTHTGSMDYISNGGSWNELCNFNEDLTSRVTSDMDIVKIEVLTNVICICHNPNELSKHQLKTIWERKEVKQMTVAEIEAILGHKVEIISDQ